MDSGEEICIPGLQFQILPQGNKIPSVLWQFDPHHCKRGLDVGMVSREPKT